MQVKTFLTHNMLESDFYHSSLLPLPMRKKISITVRPVNKGIQIPESCYFQCPFFSQLTILPKLNILKLNFSSLQMNLFMKTSQKVYYTLLRMRLTGKGCCFPTLKTFTMEIAHWSCCHWKTSTDPLHQHLEK